MRRDARNYLLSSLRAWLQESPCRRWCLPATAVSRSKRERMAFDGHGSDMRHRRESLRFSSRCRQGSGRRRRPALARAAGRPKRKMGRDSAMDIFSGLVRTHLENRPDPTDAKLFLRWVLDSEAVSCEWPLSFSREPPPGLEPGTFSLQKSCSTS